MIQIRLLYFLPIFLLNFCFTNAQNKKSKPLITQIGFHDGKIFLNTKEAFTYLNIDNDFVVTDLNGNDIIKGSIKSLGDNKFSNIITFVALNKSFYSEKIIGRNQLFFALCRENIINKNFEFDELKLNQFIEENNDSK